MEILNDIPVVFNLEAIAEQLHVSDGEDIETLRDILNAVRPIAKPKAIYDLAFIGEKGEDSVNIGGVVFTSRVLRVNLDKPRRVFPYIATSGAELNSVPGISDDPMLDYWLDEIRIITLGAAIQHVRNYIDAKYQPGPMSEMNPGSLEDWPITQQTQLFSLFGDVESKIGVRLSDSYLMRPLKSVSGILFPTDTNFESCSLCPRDDCPGRRAAYDKDLWQERYAI